MRGDTKTLFFVGAVAALTLGGTMVAFAGTWKEGEGADQGKWRYDFEDGSYAVNGWQWIDGNNDGVAECYYFDSSGWMLVGTSTPDGYTVNADGAWTENGSVQTKAVEAQQTADTGASGQDGQSQVSGGNYTWMLNADGSCNYDLCNSDFRDYFNCMSATGAWSSTAGIEDMAARAEKLVEIWVENSERGAAWKELFDRYAIPYDVAKTGMEDMQTVMFSLGTPEGMAEAEKNSFGAAVNMMAAIDTDGTAMGSWDANYDADRGRIVVFFALTRGR